MNVTVEWSGREPQIELASVTRTDDYSGEPFTIRWLLRGAFGDPGITLDRKTSIHGAVYWEAWIDSPECTFGLTGESPPTISSYSAASAQEALDTLAERLRELAEWTRAAISYRSTSSRLHWTNLSAAHSWAEDSGGLVVARVYPAHVDGRLAMPEIGVGWETYAPAARGAIRCKPWLRGLLRRFGLGAAPHYLAVAAANRVLEQANGGER